MNDLKINHDVNGIYYTFKHESYKYKYRVKTTNWGRFRMSLCLISFVSISFSMNPWFMPIGVLIAVAAARPAGSNYNPCWLWQSLIQDPISSITHRQSKDGKKLTVDVEPIDLQD